MSSAANSTIADYGYQPLDHATQQIRLVTLLDPLENDDAIRLDIEVFEISEAPPYTALSYVWGPPSNNVIHIAEGRLEIRDNLFTFLTEFRKRSDKTPSDQRLWIDQLCIDQSTTAERNHQVQMMSDIYSKATSVIAWLGDGSEKAEGRSAVLTRGRCGGFKNTYDAACVWRDRAELEAFGYILYNKYFRRLWIVQEFVLAMRIRILVKDVWLVDDIREWERRADILDDYLRHSASSSAYAMIRSSSLRRTGEFTHLDIGVAMDSYVRNSCADPRDRVYGLLGLVRLDQRVTVDYEKSIDQLYLDLILVALRSECFEESSGAEVPYDRVLSVVYRAHYDLDITWAWPIGYKTKFFGIGHSNKLGHFRGLACPITAVGLERAAMTGCEEDRFWFDFQGTRHFIYCTNNRPTMTYETRGLSVEDFIYGKNNRPMMTDETRRLLEEDWEKYVPREHGNETS